MMDIVRFPRGRRSVAQLQTDASYAVSMVKTVTGICNNAAYLVMMDAMRHVREHPAYGGKAKARFEDALKEWKRYEGNLLHATRNNLFSVAGMEPDTRKKYGDITDREYFEFWQGTGGTAYAKTRTLVTSLANKFRLALEEAGIPHAEETGWAMAATACLEACVYLWGSTTDDASRLFCIARGNLVKIVGGLSVAEPCRAWRFAAETLEPRAAGDFMDKRNATNVQLGINEILGVWSDAERIFGSIAETVGEYPELFANGKAMQRVAGVMRQMEHDMAEEMGRSRKKHMLDRLNTEKT